MDFGLSFQLHLTLEPRGVNRASSLVRGSHAVQTHVELSLIYGWDSEYTGGQLKSHAGFGCRVLGPNPPRCSRVSCPTLTPYKDYTVT